MPRTHCITSEGNVVHVLPTANGAAAVLNVERLPDKVRCGARQGIVQGVPAASRVTIRDGEDKLAGACVKLNCTPLN
jgi:hypothetical protein